MEPTPIPSAQVKRPTPIDIKLIRSQTDVQWNGHKVSKDQYPHYLQRNLKQDKPYRPSQ